MKNVHRSALDARLPSAWLPRLCRVLIRLVAALGFLPLAAIPVSFSSPPSVVAQEGTTRLYLPLVMNGASGPTSEQLIDEALARGEIDSETALTYKVYATTHHTRLPARYRGADKDDLESDALREAVRRWPTLSAKAQALLAPFLIPPIYQGSWMDPATAGSAIDVQTASTLAAAYCWSPPPLPGLLPGWQRLTTAHVTVWYQTAGDILPFYGQLATPEQVAATAQAVRAVIEYIVQQETELMGPTGQPRWPLPDTNVPCNGGDGSIDIYITRQNVKMGAQAVPYPPGEVQRPGYIWLAPDYAKGDPKTVRDALAHEFFHLISMGYPQARAESDLGLPEYQWLDEATANWMVDYVYKDDQFEHKAAPDYLYRDYGAPLERALEPGTNGYEDYVYLQFLAHKVGPQVMRAIWDATPKLDSLAAVNEGTKGAGGFEKLWPQFALAAWNDWQNGFLNDLYLWDRLEPGMSRGRNAWAPLEAALGGKRWDDQRTYESGAIDHVAIGMSRHVFGDANVRSVLFTNPLVGVRGAHVWALLKIGGTWTVEDWTDKRQTQFCRQRDAERVEEIVTIITNSVFDDREYELEPPDDPSAYPKLTYTNIACGEWQGTVTAVHRDDRTIRHDLETIHTTATFKPDPQSSPGSEYAMFVLKQGTMHWEYTGTLGDCQIQAAPVDWTLRPPNDGSFAIRQWRADMSLIGQFEGIGTSSYQPTLTYVCPEGSWEQPWQTMPWLETGSMGSNNAWVSEDGKTITGRYEWGTPGAGRSMTVDWHFVAVSPGE